MAEPEVNEQTWCSNLLQRSSLFFIVFFFFSPHSIQAQALLQLKPIITGRLKKIHGKISFLQQDLLSEPAVHLGLGKGSSGECDQFWLSLYTKNMD